MRVVDSDSLIPCDVAIALIKEVQRTFPCQGPLGSAFLFHLLIQNIFLNVKMGLMFAYKTEPAYNLLVRMTTAPASHQSTILRRRMTIYKSTAEGDDSTNPTPWTTFPALSTFCFRVFHIFYCTSILENNYKSKYLQQSSSSAFLFSKYYTKFLSPLADQSHGQYTLWPIYLRTSRRIPNGEKSASQFLD